jgi:hypothetical protein
VKRPFETVRRFAKTAWSAGRYFYFSTDKAYFDAEMAEAFGQAKPLSDFLGMLIRVTFAMAFVRYCFATPSVPRSYWTQGLRQTAGGAGIMVTAYFTIQISRVILAYYLRDMAVFPVGWKRGIALVVALYFYLAVTTTIWQPAESLAIATKLVP